MQSRQKLLLVIGLGVIASAIIYRLSQRVAQQSIALTDNSNDDSGESMVENISSTARRIWDAIPSNPFQSLLSNTEQALGLPPTLLSRIAWIESRFNPNAYNPSGATGIMQIVPSAHPGVNAKDPNAAIPYAGSFLKQLYNQFGSWEKAIAAYNWGPGNLQKDIAKNGANWKAGLPAETSNYLAQVNQVIDLPA